MIYNVTYAKDELMFDWYKVAMFVNLFWKLVEFDPDDESNMKTPENKRKGSTEVSGDNI